MCDPSARSHRSPGNRIVEPEVFVIGHVRASTTRD